MAFYEVRKPSPSLRNAYRKLRKRRGRYANLSPHPHTSHTVRESHIKCSRRAASCRVFCRHGKLRLFRRAERRPSRRLYPDAIILPSFTTTAPIGTSPLFSAAFALRRAFFIKKTSSVILSPQVQSVCLPRRLSGSKSYSRAPRFRPRN